MHENKCHTNRITKSSFYSCKEMMVKKKIWPKQTLWFSLASTLIVVHVSIWTYSNQWLFAYVLLSINRLVQHHQMPFCLSLIDPLRYLLLLLLLLVHGRSCGPTPSVNPLPNCTMESTFIPSQIR